MIDDHDSIMWLGWLSRGLWLEKSNNINVKNIFDFTLKKSRDTEIESIW